MKPVLRLSDENLQTYLPAGAIASLTPLLRCLELQGALIVHLKPEPWAETSTWSHGLELTVRAHAAVLAQQVISSLPSLSNRLREAVREVCGDAPDKVARLTAALAAEPGGWREVDHG